MPEIKYEITKEIAVLSSKGDWSKEINEVSWMGRPAKYDIREWNHKEGKMRKGITLTEDEIEELKIALNEI